MRNQDRFRGCLIGGAAGDALGYAIEFMRENRIFAKYGERGITNYDLHNGQAIISDDTQMTLFTATGLLSADASSTADSPADYANYINNSYLGWLRTQYKRFPLGEPQLYSWLMNVPELYSPRAPGNTCMSALHTGGGGTPEAPINNSRGCGGVMRVAPIGLYFNDSGRAARQVARLGAEAAALTHGEQLGWMPAAMLTQIVHELSQDDAPMLTAVRDSLDTLGDLFPDATLLPMFRELIEKAIALAAESSVSDLDAIHELGEGWTGHDALAIAVYCALRYPDDIDKALIASVNHNGDSDSTGAITGNIVGAHIGYSAIPAKYTDALELRDLILELADDLWRGARPGDPEFTAKYLDMTYGA